MFAYKFKYDRQIYIYIYYVPLHTPKLLNFIKENVLNINLNKCIIYLIL